MATVDDMVESLRDPERRIALYKASVARFEQAMSLPISDPRRLKRDEAVATWTATRAKGRRDNPAYERDRERYETAMLSIARAEALPACFRDQEGNWQGRFDVRWAARQLAAGEVDAPATELRSAFCSVALPEVEEQPPAEDLEDVDPSTIDPLNPETWPARWPFWRSALRGYAPADAMVSDLQVAYQIMELTGA